MPAASMAIFEKGSIRAALRGHVIVPMISPLTLSGELDLMATFRLADHIIDGGCQGLLVGGTNSEGPSLALARRIAQIEAVVEHTAGHGMV